MNLSMSFSGHLRFRPSSAWIPGSEYSWIHIKVINQFNTYTLALFYNVLLVLQHPYSPRKISSLESSPKLRNWTILITGDLIKITFDPSVELEPTFETHRKMTIVIIQYFPKMVECRVAFSSNGSKYRHPIFSYSLQNGIVPFRWNRTNWPIGSEELGKSVARRCTVVYICNTPHLISRFNTFTQKPRNESSTFSSIWSKVNFS